MFFELIATFVAGLGAAGLVLLLNRLTGGRLPRWTMPVAAGLSMIGYAVWSEYTWHGRTMASLPKGMSVVQSIEERAFYKPWTYVAPQVTRLAVLDNASIQTNAAAPNVRLVEIYLLGRWRAPNRVPQMINCDTHARADVSDTALSDPQTADWIVLEEDNPLVRLSCGDI